MNISSYPCLWHAYAFQFTVFRLQLKYWSSLKKWYQKKVCFYNKRAFIGLTCIQQWLTALWRAGEPGSYSFQEADCFRSSIQNWRHKISWKSPAFNLHWKPEEIAIWHQNMVVAATDTLILKETWDTCLYVHTALSLSLSLTLTQALGPLNVTVHVQGRSLPAATMM